MMTSTRAMPLQLRQHVQPAPAAVALQLVAAVGDQLQFVQHEPRDDQLALEDAGLRRCR